MDFKPHIYCREDYSCCWAVKWVTRRINPSSGALVIKHPPCWAPCGGKKHVHQEISHYNAAVDAPPPPPRLRPITTRTIQSRSSAVINTLCVTWSAALVGVVRCWLDCLFAGSQDWCGSGPAFRTESVKLTLMGVNFYKHRHSTNLHTLTWMNHYGFTASESRLNPTWLISASFPHVRTESVSCSLSLRQGSDPVWTNTWNLCHFFYKKCVSKYDQHCFKRRKQLNKLLLEYQHILGVFFVKLLK